MRKAKKFLMNTVILTATVFITRTVNIYLTVFISNKIGAEGMGVFQLILSVYMLAVTIATSGIGLAATRLVAEELAVNAWSSAKNALRKCIRYSIFFSLLTALLMILNAEYIANQWLHGKVSTLPIFALCISIPFISLSTVLNGYFTAVRRVIKSSSAQIFEQFCRVGVTVLLFQFFAPKGIDAACFALVLGGVFAEVFSFIYLFSLYLFDKRRYILTSKIHSNLMKRLLEISLPVAISSYIRSGLNTYKQVMIPFGLERSGISCNLAIAQYGMIRGMVLPILLFPAGVLTSFSELLVPEIAEQNARGNKEKINYITHRMFKVALLYSVCVGALFFGFADELGQAIYHNAEVGVFLKILSPLVVVMYLDSIVDGILKGLNQQASVMGINILDMGVSIVILSFLLPVIGINGYIVSIYVSESLNSILSFWRLKSVTNFQVNYFAWILLPTVLMGISIFVAKTFFQNFIISMVFALLFFFTLLFLLNVLEKKDFKF